MGLNPCVSIPSCQRHEIPITPLQRSAEWGMDAAVELERLEETPHQHPPSPPARRLPPYFAGDAVGFRLSAGGKCGVRFCGKCWRKGRKVVILRLGKRILENIFHFLFRKIKKIAFLRNKNTLIIDYDKVNRKNCYLTNDDKYL